MCLRMDGWKVVVTWEFAWERYKALRMVGAVNNGFLHTNQAWRSGFASLPASLNSQISLYMVRECLEQLYFFFGLLFDRKYV